MRCPALFPRAAVHDSSIEAIGTGDPDVEGHHESNRACGGALSPWVAAGSVGVVDPRRLRDISIAPRLDDHMGVRRTHLALFSARGMFDDAIIAARDAGRRLGYSASDLM